MTEIINELLSTTLQIGLFTLIPYLFFLFRKNKETTFKQYIGLNKPTKKSILYVLLVSFLFVIIGIGMTFIDSGIKQVVMEPPSITGKLRQMGLNANSLIILFMIALFKTSFAEEVLFRGFVAKQLIKKFNFNLGNILQALIFGAIHLFLFRYLTKSTIFPLVFIFIFSTVAGWVLGYIKEKYTNGSIIPGWIAHGFGNAFSYIIIAFLL